jgi:hypothetical protein
MHTAGPPKIVRLIERAADSQSATIEDVGVDHRRLDVLVAEEFLHRADVVAGFEQVRGKAVAEGVTTGGLGNAGQAHGIFDRALQIAFVHVMAAREAGARVSRQSLRREHVLPTPFFGGVGGFAIQRIGQVDLSIAGRQVLPMQQLDALEMFLQGRDEAGGQHGDALVAAFGVAHDDLPPLKVNVLDAQAHALHKPETAAIEQLGHQLIGAGHALEDLARFAGGEDDGQAAGLFGANGIEWRVKVLMEHLAIEKEQRTERLVLRGGGHVAFDRQVGEERLHLGAAHVLRVAFGVEQNVARDPIGVGLLGAIGIVLEPQRIAHLIEKFFGRLLHRSPHVFESF